MGFNSGFKGLIITAFPRQQWLRQRVWLLRYTYIVALVCLFRWIQTSLVDVHHLWTILQYMRRQNMLIPLAQKLFVTRCVQVLVAALLAERNALLTRQIWGCQELYLVNVVSDQRGVRLWIDFDLAIMSGDIVGVLFWRLLWKYCDNC